MAGPVSTMILRTLVAEIGFRIDVQFRRSDCRDWWKKNSGKKKHKLYQFVVPSDTSFVFFFFFSVFVLLKTHDSDCSSHRAVKVLCFAMESYNILAESP